MRLKSGFTLMEVIVVLSIIGILGSLGYNKFSEVMLEAKATQLGNQASKIEVGLSKYFADLGTYPLDVNWLVASDMNRDEAENYDSLSLKMGAEEDLDVKEYWSGPYIGDMKTEGDEPNKKIKASLGDKIEICAKVTENGGKSKVENCDSDVTGEDNFINVLIIKGVDPQAIKPLFKAINGRDMTQVEEENGNAFAVATGIENSSEDKYYESDKLGVPSRENYSGATPFLIYKFTDNIQN